ncbi:Myb/SANT-like domain-containing protein, partial [Cynara cardunculus var. scolymus]
MADRRNWNIQEEDVLISILQEIVAAGGRSDNGCFRTGTYEQIVLKMREKIPGLNITSKHIQNKMKRLKDKYSAAYDMLNTSGFGWDDAHQCVTVDAQVLEEYLKLKKHPSKNYIANKPFPQYERLKTIFRKDRATGSMAESAADALEHINLESAVGDDTDELNVPLTTPSNGASASSIPQDVEASSKKRKRKAGVSEDAMKVIEKGLNVISEEMGKLVSVVGTPGLQTMPDELTNMGFDDDQVIAISMYFADNPIQLRLWNSMNATLKPKFVATILK